MICEIGDDRRWWKFEPVPKFGKIALYEGKYGFCLEPVSKMTGHKIEVKRIKLPFKHRTLMELLFGARECWQVQVWEYFEGYESKKPTWYVLMDPESSREEAEKEAKGIREMYENLKEAEEGAQCFRLAEPRVCLPPTKPVLRVGKPATAEELEQSRRYELQLEERAARFKVLKTILPKTAELTGQAELTEDPKRKAELEQESVEAYFAENAPCWSPWVFKAWQRLNPIGFHWMKWLYIWGAKQAKRPSQMNAVDYELAFNWTWKGYYRLTAEQLAEAVRIKSKVLLSADAIKQRRKRLGLTTWRSPGPPPKAESQ